MERHLVCLLVITAAVGYVTAAQPCYYEGKYRKEGVYIQIEDCRRIAQCQNGEWAYVYHHYNIRGCPHNAHCSHANLICQCNHGYVGDETPTGLIRACRQVSTSTSSTSLQPTKTFATSVSLQPTKTFATSVSLQSTKTFATSVSLQPSKTLATSASLQPTKTFATSVSLQSTKTFATSVSLQSTKTLATSSSLKPTTPLSSSAIINPTTVTSSASIQPTKTVTQSTTLQSSATPETTQPQPLKPNCPDSSWTSVGSFGCIKVFDDQKATFSEARDVCKGYKGDLVTTLLQHYKTETVKGLLMKGVRYWIGVHDPDRTRTFKHVTGGTLPPSVPWAYKEPNNRGGNEFCVEMIGNGRGSWNDKRCSRRRPFICETSLQTTPKPKIMAR